MHNKKKKDRLKRLVSLVFAAILLFSQLLYVKSDVLADDTNDNNAGVTYESSDKYFSVKTNIKPVDGEKNTYDVTLTLTNKSQFYGTMMVFPNISGWVELVPDSVKTNAENPDTNISYEANRIVLSYDVHSGNVMDDLPDENIGEKFVTFRVRAKEDLIENEGNNKYDLILAGPYARYAGYSSYDVRVMNAFRYSLDFSVKYDRTKNVTVKYYKDYVSDNEEGNPNYLGEDTKTFMNYEIGTTIPMAEIPVNNTNFVPEGYVGEGEITNLNSTDGYIVTKGDNVINVVYKTKKEYPYTIEYYKDSVDATNLICAITNDSNGALRGYEGDVVSYNDVNKTYRKPDKGYKDGVIVGEDSNNNGLTITSDTSKNVIRVLYLKDSFPYTVNYYVEGENEPFKTDTDNGEFDSVIPYVDKTGDLPAEYEEKLKGYEETGEVTKYNEKGVITTDPDKNVIDVVFKLKDVPQEEIAADEDEVVKPEEKPTVVKEDVGEIAADEDEVVKAEEKPTVVKEDVGEVAADSAEVNTADINAITIRLLCVLMLVSILLVATVILNKKKKSL